MIPTPQQFAEIHKRALAYWNIPGGRTIEGVATASVMEWESIRPKDQAATGLQWRPITKAIPGCVIALSPVTGTIANYSNPTPAAPGGYTHYLDHSELAALPLMAPEPEPLAFPDPPHGWEWHNPEKLTPGQVGILDGWRLYLIGEKPSVDCEQHDDPSWLAWGSGTAAFDESYVCTYRTKAPLPTPKPTPEEIALQEFEMVFLARYPELDFDSDFAQGALDGWRQAKNQQPISS